MSRHAPPAPAHEAANPPLSFFNDAPRLMLEWSCAVLQMMVDAQRGPLEAGLAWQRLLGDMRIKPWDGWTAGSAREAPLAH